MRRILKAAMCICVLAPFVASAGPMTYELSSYSQGGFSANWLHSADGCRGGPNNNLFMCSGSGPDSFQLGISGGRISGDFEAGLLSNITGEFSLLPNTRFDGLSITGGSLGGSLWYFDFELQADGYTEMGRFFFEELNMGAGMPNSLSEDELVLWGQNSEAYVSAYLPNVGPINPHFMPLGIDLYATAVSVPEPGTLALLSLAFAGLGVARRRRNTTQK